MPSKQSHDVVATPDATADNKKTRVFVDARDGAGMCRLKFPGSRLARGALRLPPPEPEFEREERACADA